MLIIAFILRYFSNIKLYFVLSALKCYEPDSPFYDEDLCYGKEFSIVICSGIGFILWVNLYDNYVKPRLVTTVILVALSLLSLMEAIFTTNVKENYLYFEVLVTLYQIKEVFMSGILLVCVLILHNWFLEKRIGMVCSVWLVSVNL